MQKSTFEDEDRIEKKVDQQSERNIKDVHQHLNAFQLRVFVRPSPTIVLTTLQAVVLSLGADVDAMLDVRVPEPKSAPVELKEDTMFVALFITTTTLPPHPHQFAKRNRSSCS